MTVTRRREKGCGCCGMGGSSSSRRKRPQRRKKSRRKKRSRRKSSREIEAEESTFHTCFACGNPDDVVDDKTTARKPQAENFSKRRLSYKLSSIDLDLGEKKETSPGFFALLARRIRGVVPAVQPWPGHTREKRRRSKERNLSVVQKL